MPRIDVPVLHRGLRPLFRVALCSQLLWPALAFADTPYDQMVRDARAGQTTPALTVLRQVPPAQATTGQISDHLQIASWAGLDAEVVQVYETQGRDRVLPVVVSILTVREDHQQGEPVLSVSSGSGTVVTPQGHIATNAHVTQNGKSFRVVFADGRELPARLVGTDTLSDLAVLQAQPPAPETFAHAEFADTLDLQPGDTVLAMGAPWGLSNSMSAGVVNNPRRLLVSLFDDEADYEDRLGADEPTGRYYAWIQHDAAIAPGNSGGPLVDLSGRIVGVNTRGMIFGGDLAFAIPGPDARDVVRALRRVAEWRVFILRSTQWGPAIRRQRVHPTVVASPAV